jgi:hypothetical protein
MVSEDSTSEGCWSGGILLHVRSAIRDDAVKRTLPFHLGLYIIDGVRRLHFKTDHLAGERLNEDLHD